MSLEKTAHAGARALMGPDRGAKGRRWGWWYVAEHRLKTMRAYLWSILMGSVGSPLFYLFSLGVGLGALVDSQTGSRGIAGVSYVTYVGPALLASAAITGAFEELSFPVIGGFKRTKEFFSMNATVVRASQIVWGVTLAALFRIVFTVAVFWTFLAFFGAVPSPWGFFALPAAILGGLAFGAPVMAFAASLEDDDGWFALINRFVIAPLFLFSGTFYPLDSLPVGLQAVGWISPLWHVTELGRMATFGLAVPPWLAVVHLVYPLALAVLGLILAYRVFSRRLSK
jgi:lipooligosaccharide transport system permease protein